MNGSELTCVRFAPTGSGGGVTEETGADDPEHPARAIISKASKGTGIALWQRGSTIFLVTDLVLTPPTGSVLENEKAADLIIGGLISNFNQIRGCRSYCGTTLNYFALRLAARREGGVTPFSGSSFSILSESLWRGLSPAEVSTAPCADTVNPCAVNIASL